MVATASSPPVVPVALVVYGRDDCHLCHDMIAALHELQAQFSFALEVVDVDSDDELAARYGERVPVLVAEGKEICHYHLDSSVLSAYFAEIR